MSLDMFFQHFFNALTLGSLYGLIAIGYTMVYGILRLINFAHGDILMLGAYFVFYGTTTFFLPWGVAVVVAILAASAVGILVDRIAYRPLRDAPRISALISAIAVSFFIESLSVVVFSGLPRPVYQPEWLMTPINFGQLKLLPITLVVPVVSFVLVLGLLWIIHRTKPGLAMRAISKDIETTRLLGVRVDRIIALALGHHVGPALPADQPLHGHLPRLQGLHRGGARRHRLHPGRHDRRAAARLHRDHDRGLHAQPVRLPRRVRLRGAGARAPRQAHRPFRAAFGGKDMKTSMRNLLLNLAAIGLLALFLVWAETNLDGYKVQILNLIAVNAILALSLNLIYGFTGMFSLGHAGFMAIGAYVSALCVLPAAQKEMMWILEDIIWPFSVIHTPFWFSVVAGGFVAAIFGLFIAIPVLRLGGDYLGIATLGFAEIIRVLIVNLTPITNGSLGIKGIPFHASLLVNYGWLLITLYCMVKLLGSNFGNIFKAIRDDEIAAKVMGIDTFRTKVLSFCLGAFFAGVGGALLGNLLTTIDPKMFTFLLTFNVLMIVVAGGLGSLTGSILGSAVITVLLEWLRAVEDPITLGGFAIPGIPGMRMVVFSLVLLCIILYRREGIMGMREITWDAIFDFFSRRKRA